LYGHPEISYRCTETPDGCAETSDIYPETPDGYPKTPEKNNDLPFDTLIPPEREQERITEYQFTNFKFITAMNKQSIPRTIAGFTEYIKIAYQKAAANLSAYGIPADKLAAVTPLYNDFVAKEAIAANPETATKGNREARDEARKTLEKIWRQFLNESIRFNTAVSIPDKEVFGISPHTVVRTPPKPPTATGITKTKRMGAFEYDVTVIDVENSKRKLPENAAGSYLYLAVSDPGVLPEDLSAYRRMAFTSGSHHDLRFSSAELGKQANIYVCYANRHGKEGPIGKIETFLIN
jgi:hypothetical protein